MTERQTDGSSDRMWVVLTEHGRIAGTLARAHDPDEIDIIRSEDSLKAHGLAGWLAIQSHSIYTPTAPVFLEVRPLGQPKVSFADAVTAFHDSRGI